MRLGFALPQFGGQALEADRVAGCARQLEELGADSLWVGDRVLAPVEPTVPYSVDPPLPVQFRASLDPLVLLAVAAAATTRVRLGTNVLVAPWYPPILLARTVTSLDRVSGGRLVLGLGSGWSPDEYRAVGIPWRERGSRLDETLDLLDTVWTDTPAEHAGRHFTVPRAHFELKPVRRPPIFLAGFTPRALRRVIRRADGWLPVWHIPARSDRMLRVRAALPDELRVILRVNVSAGVPLDRIADELRTVGEAVRAEEVIVDFLYQASSVSEAVDLAGALLEA